MWNSGVTRGDRGFDPGFSKMSKNPIQRGAKKFKGAPIFDLAPGNENPCYATDMEIKIKMEKLSIIINSL